jgi:hypothetical protein
MNRIVNCPGEVRNLRRHFELLQCALAENFGNHHVVNHIMHLCYDAWLLQKASVASERTLRELMKGRRSGRILGLGPSQRAFLKRRAWYRRVNRVVYLEYEEPEFEKFWGKFLDNARKAHSATFGSLYADYRYTRALKEGKKLSIMSLNTLIRESWEQFYELKRSGRGLLTLDPVSFQLMYGTNLSHKVDALVSWILTGERVASSMIVWELAQFVGSLIRLRLY